MEYIPEEPDIYGTQCETPRLVGPNVDSYNPDPSLTPHRCHLSHPSHQVVLLPLGDKKEKPPWWTSLICNWKSSIEGLKD